jgi:hypothetical protein
MNEELRYTDDGSIVMVWADGMPVRCPDQHDMDHLPVGADMSADEVETLPD